LLGNCRPPSRRDERRSPESLEETLRILSDPDLLAQVRASLMEREEAVPMTKEEAARLIARGDSGTMP
jgi:hypothetical protein